MKKGLIAAAVLALPVLVAPTVSANSSHQNQHQEKKVTICHRTNSVTNPYEEITVDESAVDGQGASDHYGQHKGPVATSEAVAQIFKNNKIDWGDIIPPVQGVHAGLNWTAEGQAILRNGCKYVNTSTPPPTTTTPTEGGRGGAVVETAPAPEPQVSAPSRSTNAGAGGASGSILAPLAAMGASLGTAAYGLVRFRKFDA